jgi:hypothetical protein
MVMTDLGRFSALSRDFDRCDRQLRDLGAKIAR